MKCLLVGLPGLTGVSVTALDKHPRRPSVICAYTSASHLGLVSGTDAGRTWISMGFHQGDRDAVSADPSHSGGHRVSVPGVKIRLDTYSHVLPGMQEQAVQRLQARLFDSVATEVVG